MHAATDVHKTTSLPPFGMTSWKQPLLEHFF